MKHFLTSASFLILFLFILGEHTQAQDIWEARAEKLAHIEARLDSSRALLDSLQDQGRSLALAVNLLKEKEQLSSSEHNRLEKLMLQIDHLSYTVGLERNRMTRIHLERESVLQKDLADLESAIDSLITRLEQTGSDEKRILQGRLVEMLGYKKDWQGKLTPAAAGEISFAAIEANPDDSSRLLRLKGDLLMDRIDWLHQEGRATKDRIGKLRSEVRLRSRLDELGQDMALFNEEEELSGRAAADPGSNQRESNATLNLDGKAYSQTLAPIYPSDLTTLRYLLTAPYPDNITDLKKWIDLLSRYQTSLERSADSLGTRAQWFYKHADEKSKK